MLVDEAEPIDWRPSTGVDGPDDAAGVLLTGAHAAGRPTFVLSMPNGRVAGRFGSVITPDDRLLVEASFGFVDDDRHHPVRRRLRLGPIERLEGTAATVAFGYADAYYHWMFDLLPRLEILRRAGYDLDDVDHLVVNGAGAPYEAESLRRFGVPADRVRTLRADHQFVADRLVVPSTVGVCGEVPAWAAALLRKRFLDPRHAEEPPLRLYVSRADAAQRRVAEEERLVPRLEQLGFTCLTLTGRPLDEQIALFARAEIVVGPHGGGLTNLVWCRPGAAVVELYGDDYVNPVFWKLATLLDLRHHHVIGHPADAGLPRGYGEMVVDHDAVIGLVERALG